MGEGLRSALRHVGVGESGSERHGEIKRVRELHGEIKRRREGVEGLKQRNE